MSALLRVLVLAALSAGLLTAPAATAVPADPPHFVKKQKVIGKTVTGRKIVAYFRGDPKAERVLVVLGQMHGDEPAGVRTATYIRAQLRPKRGAAVWVVPTMNPDGKARGTRTNARGVDLNRNWPTSGWIKGVKGSRTYGGPTKASERETRAMMRFLRRVKPDYIASIHQPLYGIGISDKDAVFEKRLASRLDLPRKHFGVVQGSGTSPTLTGWYNRYLGKHGTAITIEYGANPSTRFVKQKAGRGILGAARVIRKRR